MDRKESRNGLELIKYASIRLKGNFSALFLGALAMVTPLTLVFLVPFIISILTETSWIMSIGIVIFAIFVGPLQMGYIKYFNETIDGKQPKISRVYSQIRFSIFTLRTIYIALILLILYIIGGILWIVPAGFAISFYSMTLFFLEKYNYERLSGAMNDCAKQMIGNRLAMFSYKLIFYLIYFFVFVVGALCLALVFLLAMDSLIVSWIVAVCSTIVFIFMYTMITVYYHSCNQIFFEDVLKYQERKRTKINNSIASHKNENNLEKVDELNVSENPINDDSLESNNIKENIKNSKKKNNKNKSSKKDKTTKSDNKKKTNKIKK